jgi:patatin-like phospholipase/acyl hydrolase
MPYRILSLDGGGSWALIQARVLLDIYGDIRGHELLRKFDMAIGNSGGSLVLASLCNDMKPSEIISVFMNEKQRKEVFSKLQFWEKMKWRNIASLFTRAIGPRYSTERKIRGLKKVLTSGDHLYHDGIISKPIVETPLDELPAIIKKETLQLLIVGFDYFKERVCFFRSHTKSNTDSFGKGKFFRVSLADAIHSSSNAPVNYFDEPAMVHFSLMGAGKKENSKTWFWDGAVSGFNNPVLAGLVEAVTNQQLDMKEYCILSLGTGTGSAIVLTDLRHSDNPESRDTYEKNKNIPYTLTDTSPGFVKDIKKMSTSILGDPPDSATFIAYSFLDPALNNSANLVRINPSIKPEKDSNTVYGPPAVYKNLPGGERKFQKLMELDMDAVENEQVELINELCDHFIRTDDSPSLPNQLIRGDKNGKHLGYASYKEAKAKWVNDCM